VAKTSSTAGLISRTRYEPYGATAAGTEPTIGFTGHLNAANLGLVDMQQRFYDPVAGRFLSIGPVVTDAGTGGGFNRYAYANNSPYKYVDPDGRDSCVAQSGGGQTCTYTVNTTVGGAAAMTVGAGIWNTGVAIYNHAATKDKSESGSAASAKVAEKAVERKDAYVVRVQAQGTTLKNETSVPIVGSTPIKAEAVQYALGVTAAGLTSKEQAKMAPAFNKASDWVNAVAASGGFGPEGARSQTFRVPGNTPGEARVDVEVIKGHNIVQ
jgi:RHS repeat-associated protein